LSLLLLATATGINAQRTTDYLDRGLVAVKTTSGVFCSWRIQPDEYYDVKYNIYRDGTKLNSEPLEVSNFTDTGGSLSSKYSVEAVVRGTAQAKCNAVTPWAQNYLEVKMDHGSLTSTYIPNDACAADVDGDGEVELLIKFDNSEDIAALYPDNGNNGEYAIIECYKLNGKKLWWIDMGPNMTDFQNNETNIVAYDWDQDGKAEAVLRASDGTIIHMADGTTYEIGDKTKNYRHGGKGSSAVEFFVHEGDECLLYLNGETGKPYQCMEYPLKRLESGETDLSKAWGDGYGHRSTKHFFGAPYLDGKKPSIFLARGIYTRHKMIALDVNLSTHELTERWRWNCNDSSSPWYGQGYHNYSIADVDWDGRDEICFGSMVIDDNGNGLSTTGLGHGDSQHVGDFDPYTHGQEIFACNETNPNNNFRDATTSKIYYRTTGGNDDGRALAGNFVDDIPGAQAISSRDDNIIGGAAHGAAEGYSKSSFSITQNFRIYWDGDLCEESFDYSNGKNTAGAIYKATSGLLTILEGSLTNNDTKGTPDLQADILGDWREEVIMRTSDNNIRIYTTDIETKWRNYSLWYDHQYRNAMVWQMCGYNQAPHVSYFLGEKEDITVAPPPLTLAGRTEISNGSSIGSSLNDKHILLDETGNVSYTVSDGAAPYILTDNAPTWVQGHDDNDNITAETYTHTLNGGAFTGEMRLVKQGDGILVLPNVTETYSGNTDIWAGTLSFDGTMQNSLVWLNRHTTLKTNGGKFQKGVKADYNATITIGESLAASSVEISDLTLNFGSRVEFDIFSTGTQADVVKATTLTINTVDWKNGPTYSTPIFNFVPHLAYGESTIAAGKYLIGEIGTVTGNISDIVIEGLSGMKTELSLEDGKLYLSISNYDSSEKTWAGSVDGTWDIDGTANFAKDSESINFVPGDVVTFDDTATNTDITIIGNVSPKSIVFNNETKAYTFSGDSIVGNPAITKTGAGSVTINNVNHIGSTAISGGRVSVNSLANSIGQDYGALGGIDAGITISNEGTLAVTANSTVAQPIYFGSGGGSIDVANGVILAMAGGLLKPSTVANSSATKTGKGTLTLSSGHKISRLIIKEGSVSSIESDGIMALPSTVEFQGGTLYDSNSQGTTTTSNTKFFVDADQKGSIYLDPRCNYKGALAGSGQLTVYAAGVRNYLQGNWSAFEGTVVAAVQKRGTYDPSFDWSNSYGLPKATLSINSGVTFNAGSSDLKLDGLAGSGTLNSSKTVTIGCNGSNISYTGKFSGSPALVKTGNGDWTLATTISTVKTITVNQGYMSLSNTKGADLSGGTAVSVSGSGILRGRGSLSSITINSGGTLRPGVYTGNNGIYQAITTSGAITVNNGGIVEFNIVNNKNTNGARSFLIVKGALTINGTINVTADDSYQPTIDDEIIFWTAGSFAGTPTIGKLPTLPDGMKWDTTGLSDGSGTLKVIADTGIDNISANETVNCDVFNLQGVKIATLSTSRADVAKAIKAKGLSGIFIVRMKTSTASGMAKIIVD